jgi:transposase
VPGIGQITALNPAQRIDAGQFKSGRHFAGWLGLTPKEQSSGGKRRLGAVSKMGNETLRRLLVVGAWRSSNTPNQEAARPRPGC